MAASVPSATYFATAEQAALFYARKEAGRDTSDLTAPPPPPPPAPSQMPKKSHGSLPSGLGEPESSHFFLCMEHLEHLECSH